MLRLVTDLEPLAAALMSHFEATIPDTEIHHRRHSIDGLELRYREGEGERLLPAVLDAIKPLQPSVLLDPALEEADLELRLGDLRGLDRWRVKVYSDSEQVAETFREFARSLGMTDAGQELGFQKAPVMAYGGANALARQLLRWYGARAGVRLGEEKRWGDDDSDIWLYIPDPSLADKPPRERYEVEVVCDHYEVGRGVINRLEAEGFTRLTLRVMDVDTARGSKFTLDPGAFSKGAALEDFEQLRTTIRDLLNQAEVDPERHPLEVESGEDALKARVTLPLGVFAEGALPPYVGDIPERFAVNLRTDEPGGVTALKEQLEQMGFHEVTVEMSGAGLLGFQIRWGGARDAYDVRAQLKELVQGQMAEMSVPSELSLYTTFEGGDAPAQITIDFPTTGLSDGRLLRRLEAACSHWEFTLKAPDPAGYQRVVDALKPLEWKAFEVEHEAVTDARIKYGGAPPALVAWVREQVHTLTGIKAELDKAWDNDDDDIWVCLTAAGEQPMEAPASVDLSGWFGALEGPERPFFEVQADRVMVGEVVLPRRAPDTLPLADRGLIPASDLFAHYCLDQRTAETLHHVAQSAALREPCLLEGETSTSKTSSVLYLAAQIGQPVVRLNLNGQTDTGELIGRFLPESLSTLPTDPEVLLADPDSLHPDSLATLERARDEGRALTEIEVQRVRAQEGLPTRPWRWQDGLVVAAMRRGWWVVLDELNLAEPQILERLNSVLERTPSLVLSEHDNSVIGPGGDPVHPHFRIFATMNPAEYAGRTALSPAYRDRWTGYRFVPSPGEAEYLAMLRHLVFGQQPDVTVFGARFNGTHSPAAMPDLAELANIEGFLVALARFHAALESAVGRGAEAPMLGARRKERYVFTRRGLLSVMDYLQQIVARGAAMGGGDPTRGMRLALVRYYLGRIASAEDQQTVLRLLDAAGIGPNTWSPGTVTEGRAAGADVPASPVRLEAEDHMDVILQTVGHRKIQVIKVVRELAELGLAEAKSLVDTTPSVVLHGASEADAQAAIKALERVGARAVTRPGGGL